MVQFYGGRSVRKRHYRTSSVNSTDRETARLLGSESRCTKNSEAVYHIVSKDHAQSDPNQLIQQLSNSVKGRELLEMLEKALKESDPADLEEDAKYTRRVSCTLAILGECKHSVYSVCI